MPTLDSASSKSPNPAAVAEAINNITAALERMTAGFITLKSLLLPEAEIETAAFDPKSPANKHEVGGLMKLTPRGIEICYRLFDSGKSRYAVAMLMEISFGAATHRFDTWKKLGGVNRSKQPLE